MNQNHTDTLPDAAAALVSRIHNLTELASFLRFEASRGEKHLDAVLLEAETLAKELRALVAFAPGADLVEIKDHDNAEKMRNIVTTLHELWGNV